MRRRTFVELTGISLAGTLIPGATGTSQATGIESLVLMLTGASPESSATPPDLPGLTLSVTRARQDYQGCRYAELAHAALRAAEDTAPQEVATRPAVATLAQDLATLAPVSIRRDAEQFASRIGASR